MIENTEVEKREPWKRNLYILWFTQVLSLMSFGLVLPFIPLYLRDLGVEGYDAINYWTGIMSFVPAFFMVIALPIWGALSDRYGRKLMLLRAMIAGVVILVGMGLCQNVWQFLALRVLQGIFTGTIPASMTLVAASTPPNRMSYALGLLASSNAIGYSLGPVIGGFLANVVGIRGCFFIAGVIMTIGLLLVVFLVYENKESYKNKVKEKKEKLGFSINSIKLKFKGASSIFTYSIVMFLVFVLVMRTAKNVLGPFVAIFVEQFTTVPEEVTMYTGIINAAVCIAGAVSALTITRLGDVLDKRKLILWLSIISLPIAIITTQVSSLVAIIFLVALFYIFSGGVEPIVTSAVSEEISPEKRGAVLGYIGAATNLGMMIAPMIGAQTSVSFGIQSIMYLIPIFTAVQIVVIGMNMKKKES